MKFLILFVFFLSSGFLANTENSVEEIIKSSRVIDLKYSRSFNGDCHKLTKIKLETNGIITFEISRLKEYGNFNCSVSKVYDVYVYPSDKGASILGAKGVHGKKTDDIFYIQVSPSYLKGSPYTARLHVDFKFIY